jgi:hypothetical protein
VLLILAWPFHCTAFAAALYVLSRQDISLAALDAAVGDDSCAQIHLLELLAHLDKLGDNLSDVISSDDDDDADVAAVILQERKQRQAAKAAAGRSSQTQDSKTWCSAKAGSPHQTRFRALAALRQTLVASRQQPGPAGLLSNAAAVAAFQELLPYSALLDLAITPVADRRHSSSSSNTEAAELAAALGVLQESDDDEDRRDVQLLALLPPPQRAWLLADAAAAMLMPDDDRWVVLHCPVTELLLASSTCHMRPQLRRCPRHCK